MIYGDATDSIGQKILSLTDSNAPLQTLYGLFSSDPLLEVDPVAINGTMDEPLRNITLSVEGENFRDGITSGTAFPPVKVKVWELHISGSDHTYYQLFSGTVTRAITNPKGREGLYQLQVAGAKYSLKGKSCGIPMLEHCDNTFGDGDTCKVDLVPITQTGSLTLVSGQVATITGLTYQAKGYWVKGYIEFFGTRIRIIKWDESTSFTLARIPPLEWYNEDTPNLVTVIPGCDNSLSVCGGTWNNTSDFNGVGFGMPTYHPVMENPRGT